MTRRLLHNQVVILYVNLMDDSFAEATVDEYRGKANHIDPNDRNGRCGGAQICHVSCQTDPLPRLSEPVVRRESRGPIFMRWLACLSAIERTWPFRRDVPQTARPPLARHKGHLERMRELAVRERTW